MKKERKLALLRCFPAVPSDIMGEIGKERKVSRNFVVFLTRGDELFARCFHQYYDGSIAERQRYVFARDGCCRYGVDEGNRWLIRTEFREPTFCKTSYGYNSDNSYTVLNRKAIKDSWMRYCCCDKYNGDLFISYLALYTKHPNIEYLMKAGYDSLISSEPLSYYWGERFRLTININIDLKSNNLLKMLRLNRTEFKLLRGSERYYTNYIAWRTEYPSYRPDELLGIAKKFGCEFGMVKEITDMTGLRLMRIASYLSGQHIAPRDYLDYIRQCRDLQYDLNDTAIALPRNFAAMHTRLSNIIEYVHDDEVSELFALNYEPRRELEYANGEYFVRQPHSLGEITAEGKLLNHCVGGYARRHAEGKLTILFIRKSNDPENPLYTMELSNTGRIVQVRGRANCTPTEEAKAFIRQYKQHIDEIFRKKARETA